MFQIRSSVSRALVVLSVSLIFACLGVAGPLSPAPGPVQPTGPALSELRAEIERSFGRDLSNVRAHTGESVRIVAEIVTADAMAIGEGVVIPGVTGNGVDLEVVAHEAAHVAQQGAPSNRTDFAALLGDSTFTKGATDFDIVLMTLMFSQTPATITIYYLLYEEDGSVRIRRREQLEGVVFKSVSLNTQQADGVGRSGKTESHIAQTYRICAQSLEITSEAGDSVLLVNGG